MKLGWIGLGRLGLPCAGALADAGHDVAGYDLNPAVGRYLASRDPDKAGLRYVDPRVDGLDMGRLDWCKNITEVVANSDVVFVAVQTPHAPQYSGEQPAPDEPRDFEYGYLVQAVRDVTRAAASLHKTTTVVVVSTVLPGTTDRLLRPLMNDYTTLVYSPQFIAMGTVLRDFRNPEFLLIGADDPSAVEVVSRVFQPIHDRPRIAMSITSAEATKVFYNTFISMKIVWANHVAALCEATGADVDDVTDALTRATERIISPAYMSAGMGDGGACFVPGTDVITAEGPRAIEQIEPGDRVLTADGTYAPVVQRKERRYGGLAVKVQIEGMPPVTATADHGWYVRSDLRRVKPDGRRDTTRPIRDNLSEITKVPAADLSTGSDFAVWPIPTAKTLRPAHATDIYLELAGWYLSDGSLDCRFSPAGNLRSGRVTFHLNDTTKAAAADQIGSLLLQEYPPKSVGEKGARAAVSVIRAGHKADVRYGHTGLVSQLLADFRSGAHNKMMPQWLLQGDAYVQTAVLRGLFGGDGTWSGGEFSYTTVSADLAYGVVVMLERLGVAPRLRQMPPPAGTRGFAGSGRYFDVRVSAGQSVLRLADLLGVTPPDSAGRQLERSPAVDGARVRRVTRTTQEHYTGTVYNLWVDHPSHSYVTSAGLVSNCHPRDLIALHALERRHDLPPFFASLASMRDVQTSALAELAAGWAGQTGMPIEITGVTYKREVPLLDGSPAMLLYRILLDRGHNVAVSDPVLDDKIGSTPKVYVVGMDHREVLDQQYPAGSVVIDPWGSTQPQQGVTLVRPGRR